MGKFKPLESEQYANFLKRVTARLEKGGQDYGDTSFSKDGPQLLEEIKQELEDVAGWSFILWTRLDKLTAIFGPRNGTRQ